LQFLTLPRCGSELVIVIPYPATSQSESAIELSDSSMSASELTIQAEVLFTLQVTNQQTGYICDWKFAFASSFFQHLKLQL